MSRHTMIGRIWLGSGICGALRFCSSSEMRLVLEQCEKYLAIRDRGVREREERVELEDWRRIVISEIQMRQILNMRADRGLD